MQTFRTDRDIIRSAKNLDKRRLNCQIKEAIQIAHILLIEENRWKNHPNVKRWKGFEDYLVLVYIPIHLSEWIKREGKSDVYLKKLSLLMDHVTGDRVVKPTWMTDKLIEEHRSNLVGKYPEYYKPLFVGEKI